MTDDLKASTDRRTFLKQVGAGAAAAAAATTLGGSSALGAAPAAAAPVRSARAAVRFGMDVYSVGMQNWPPLQTLDFAAKWKLEVVHFSEPRFLGSTDLGVALAPDNLRQVRARADELGMDLEIGMLSICPTASNFNAAAGTPEQQITRMLDAAKIMRSPIVRCVMGTQADRRTGIEKHIDDMVKVLKDNRSRIMDAGVKMSIENHAGDMQARELKGLIDMAGPEYVGVTLDSGNPVWTIESPHLTLETLAPYVLTSHVRDSYCFNSPQGTAVQWSRMGEGNMGMEDYLKRYVELCPGRAVSLEVIVSATPRIFNYRDPAAWDIFKTTPAWEFSQFLAMCDHGEPRPLPSPGAGRGQGAGGGAGRGGGAAAPAGAPAPGAQAAAPQAAAGGAAPAAGAARGGGGGRGQATPEALAKNVADVEASLDWTQKFLATLA